jgi:hypothetical protein
MKSWGSYRAELMSLLGMGMVEDEISFQPEKGGTCVLRKEGRKEGMGVFSCCFPHENGVVNS